MKRCVIHFLPLLLAAALLSACAAAPAETGRPGTVVLRYDVASAQTNAYSVQIESQGESGREIIGGTFLVIARPADSNFITLTMRGQLRNKPQPGMGPMLGYRPGQPSLAAYTFGMQSQERELMIDERGRIVRQAGDQPLPIPLGQLAGSLIQPFPAAATAGWEDEEDVFVLDEPLLQGPAPAFLSQSGFGGSYVFGMPGRGAQGVLAARQKTKVNVTEAGPTNLVLQKTFSLDTRLLTDTEPRVSASGEGRIEFDRALGLPRRVELECKMVAVTENVSRRSLLKLRWQLLEGTEREKALAPPAPPPPETKFTPEEITRLREQLESDRPGARQTAAMELSGKRLGTPTPELLIEMASLAGDDDDTVRRAALSILANHGGKEEVPVLIKALNDPDAANRAAAAKALGRLQDPRAIGPLVSLLATGQSDQPYSRPSHESAAADALVRLGSAAEPAVLALLEEKNVETRIQACNILRQIGTKASLALLENLTPYPNKELSEAAAAACRAIEARQEK